MIYITIYFLLGFSFLKWEKEYKERESKIKNNLT